MHEYAMTRQIVESVIASAESHRAKKISEVYLTIGKFTYLNPDQVRFWFDLLKKDNRLLANSKLRIKLKEGVVQCDQCGYRGKIKYVDDALYHLMVPSLECPRCSALVTIVEGKECKIDSIKAVV